MIGDRETLQYIRNAIIYRDVVMGRDALGREVKNETRLFDKANELLSKMEDLRYHMLHESHLETETKYDIRTLEHKVTAFVNAAAHSRVTEQQRLYAGENDAIQHAERVALALLIDCLTKPPHRETIDELYARKEKELIERMRGGNRLSMTQLDAVKLITGPSTTEETQSGQS